MKWRSLEESSSETDTRPLREIFAERKELITKYVPAETQAVHARAVAELKQQGLAANILPVGSIIPEFQLPDHNGKTISSSDLLAKGRLILCFIRGRWCPFCVAQMEAMNLILPEIEQAGATLAAISPQTVQNLSSCGTSTSCASLFSPMLETPLRVSSDSPTASLTNSARSINAHS